VLAKVFKGVRFDAQLYNDFKSVASAGGCTATGAFERFMSVCVEGGVLVFPERNIEGIEVEARVLVDWLRKGKYFYRGKSGVEVSVPGRLVELLVKVRNSELRAEMEDALKSSVSKKE
jgi:hypothetical protein